ncbi:MAG: hypothetical protein KF831_03700 [Acidobacteria bacterium]|nr:hypothetical protein [Acidobacteriota bacterium]
MESEFFVSVMSPIYKLIDAPRLVPAVFWISLMGVVLFGFSPGSAQQSGFDYLTVRGNSVKTTHQAKYEIKIDPAFKLLGELHHRPTYDKKQFNVSFAAFSDGKYLVMVHAETHTDGSGGLDYSNLTPGKLNGLTFTSREQCASAEDETELNGNPQIQFIRKTGFNFALPFYLKQYFTSSEDGKAEVVISYGTSLSSCENLSDGFKSQIERQIQERVSVSASK